MRILYFYQYFTTPKGAWSTRAYEMARRWVDNGDRVTILTSVYDKSDLKPTRLIDTFDVEGIQVVVLNVRLSNKHGVGKRALTFILYAALASWYAIRYPFDVVVASSGPITVGLPGIVARTLKRVPFVFEIRDLWSDSLEQMGIVRRRSTLAFARFFERSCYRVADHVIACSPGQASGVLDAVPGVPVSVVSNASDLELRERAQPKSELPDWTNNPYVVYAGTLGQANNCWQLLNVAQCLTDMGRDDVNVVMIGDGADRLALEASVRERKLENVKFMGLLPKDQVVTWLRHATASMLSLQSIPVFDTVSPNKLFDSFAVGVPVLQTTQGWIKDLFEEENCGITAAPDDSQAIADAICRLADDAALRNEMGRNARRVAEEQFDRDLLAERMRRVLAEVAGQPVESEDATEEQACAA